MVLTSHLVIDDYRRQLFNYMVATTSALVVGKFILLAKAPPLLRRFDEAALIAPVLLKTLVYFTVVLIVRLIEEIVEYWVRGGGHSGTLPYIQEQFARHRFAAAQIWIFVLFLVYTTPSELDNLSGDGELRWIFFKRSAADLALACRQRTHTNAELRERTSLARAEQAGRAARVANRADPQTDPCVTGGHRASSGAS